MKTPNFKGIFLSSILLSFFLLSGCDSTKSQILLTMKNNSNEEIHLWTDSESIDPSNKLAPGASRSKDRPYFEDDAGLMVEWIEITVFAGRNGATITSKTFRVDLPKSTFTVVYSGGALSSAQ